VTRREFEARFIDAMVEWFEIDWRGLNIARHKGIDPERVAQEVLQAKIVDGALRLASEQQQLGRAA